MKKENVYVPIANKKEAKRAKAVLEALGEKVEADFYLTYYNPNNGGLYFNEEFKTWCIAISFGGSNPNTRTKTTLKQLIELLVSEQPADPEKIAVRVDNEKEFNALMKYYDSLGWKWGSGLSPLEYECKIYFPSLVIYEDNFFSMNRVYAQYEGYRIIPFSEFAKEHGIRVPRLTTFDGVDVFDGDTIAVVNLKDHNKGNRNFLINERDTFDDWVGITHYTFSTEQAALDWIEAQKPKSIEFNLYFGGIARIIKEKSEIEIGSIKLSFGDIHDLKAKLEELNS